MTTVVNFTTAAPNHVWDTPRGHTPAGIPAPAGPPASVAGRSTASWCVGHAARPHTSEAESGRARGDLRRTLLACADSDFSTATGLRSPWLPDAPHRTPRVHGLGASVVPGSRTGERPCPSRKPAPGSTSS